VALEKHICCGIFVTLGGCRYLDGLEAANSVEHCVEIVRGLQRRICKGLLCSSPQEEAESSSSGMEALWRTS
jgi:hypothetical protein